MKLDKRPKIVEKDTDDALEVIYRGLQLYGGVQKSVNDYMMIVCPFHDDHTPSLGIYMRRDNPNIPLGWANCFACGHMHWNKIAEHIGAEKIRAWDTKEKNASFELDEGDESRLLNAEHFSIKTILRMAGCPEAQPWPPEVKWRGFKGQLLAAVGAMIISDRYNDDIGVVFPIKIGRKIYGAVKAVFNKKQGQLGYITMKGPWVSNYGLFPYDHVYQMIKKNGFDFVILVEGPRDALRLIALGIPALAILGAQNFRKKKKLYVQALGVSFVYSMPDNDEGGSKMWALVKETFAKDSGRIVRRFKLPRDHDEDGNLIKIDPCNAPKDVIDRLKDFLRTNHKWKPAKI